MTKPVAILVRLLILLLVTVCVLLAVAILRALLLPRLPLETDICSPSEADFIALDDAMIQRFQTALRFRTVARSIGNYDREQLTLQNDHIINSEWYVFFILVK